MNIVNIRQWTVITDKKNVSREYANKICDDIVRLTYEGVAGNRVFWSNRQAQLVGRIFHSGSLHYEEKIVTSYIYSVERLPDDDDGNPVLCFWVETGTGYKARQDDMAEDMRNKLLGGVEQWEGDPYLKP